MPEIFGIDLAGIVNDALTSAGGLVDGTLTRTVPGSRDPSDPTAGPSSSTVTVHAFQGFFENLTVRRREGSLVREVGQYVTIMGASIIPAVEPRPEDVISIEGRTVRVLELVSRDPAAAAYVLRVGA